MQHDTPPICLPLVAPPAPAAARPYPPRRVRTASSLLVEFFYVYDVLYAPVAAGFATGLLSFVLPWGEAEMGCLFAGLTLVLFFFFWLSLINCNPYAPGSTREDQLERIENALPFRRVTAHTDLATLAYPVVFKPSLCSTNSSGVELISSAEAARCYMASTLEEVVIAQQYHPGEEFTIMWERWPWQTRW